MSSQFTADVARARIDDWHRQAHGYRLARTLAGSGTASAPGPSSPRPRRTLLAMALAVFVVLAAASSAMAMPARSGGHAGSGGKQIQVCLPKRLPDSGACRHASVTLDNLGAGELSTGRAGEVGAARAAQTAPGFSVTAWVPEILVTLVGLAFLTVGAIAMGHRRTAAA